MTGKTETVTVIFQPSGRRGAVPKGLSVLEASRQLGADLEALCGEKRTCGKCKVRIEKGRSSVSEWQKEEGKFINEEEREAGYRLGCCAKIEGHLLVFVPEESRAGKQVVSKAARKIQIDWNPAVKLHRVTVPPPV